jgi:hypothetical protein
MLDSSKPQLGVSHAFNAFFNLGYFQLMMSLSGCNPIVSGGASVLQLAIRLFIL